MANGYHLFSTGEVLTAANVNDYLMKQTVMIFASASARTTALSGVLREGMLSYRLDAHVLEVYNGTIWEAPETNLTTKGDLATFDTAPTRLAVGSDGQTLVANSANASGLGWATQQIAGKNCLINGGFDIWQRGTSSAGNAYLADRWYSALISGTGTFAQEATTVPTGVSYAMKFTASATAQPALYQAIETLNSLQFAGQNVTVSSQVAASASTGFTMDIQYSTSVDNSVTGTWTSITATSGGTATATSTTYVPISGVYAIPSTAKSLRVRIFTTSTIANAVVVYFGKAQTELGTIATFFTRNASTLQGELVACQRYYYRATGTSGGGYGYLGTGIATSTTGGEFQTVFPVTMRTNPTAIDYSTIRVSDAVTGSGAGTLTINTAGTFPAIGATTVTGVTGLTQYRPYFLQQNGLTTAYLGFSAEL